MAENPNQPRRTTGENPRTTRIRDIVLPAVIELLLAEGTDGVSAVCVSQRTGIARSTIYRHWPDQHALILGAIERIVSPHAPTIITDDLHADLTTALSDLRMRMTKRPFRVIFATLLDRANHDRAFVAPQRRFVSGVLQPIRDILVAGMQRGDLPSTVDVDEAIAQLTGPLFTQHIMLRTSISDELIANPTRQLLHQHSA